MKWFLLKVEKSSVWLQGKTLAFMINLRFLTTIPKKILHFVRFFLEREKDFL